MHILITGGTGLIGQSLIPVLIKKNYQVVLLTRNKKAAQDIFGKQVSGLDAIVEDLQQVNFNHLDAVINLAGEPIVNKRWTRKQKQELCESRWQLTQQLVNMINSSQTPPSVFISGSAIGIYGRQGGKMIDETFEDFYPEFSHTLCHEWEKIACQAESEKTRVCLSRTGIVLAPDGGALEKMLPAFRFGLGGPIASGAQMMSWIHIEDMVKMLVFLLENDTLFGPFNATAPNPVSNEEFSKTLAKALNRPCIFRVPETVMKLAMGEMSDLLVHGQAVVPRKLQEAGFQFRYPELGVALASILQDR